MNIQLILTTNRPEIIQVWRRISRRVLCQQMDIVEKEGPSNLRAMTSNGEIISVYEGNYQEEDLLNYCLEVSALALNSKISRITFSQYAGSF